MSVLTTNISQTNSIRPGDVEALLAPLGLTISPRESSDFHTLLATAHDCAENVLALPDYQPVSNQRKYPRENVRRCGPDEQVLGQAWATKFLIRGNPDGGPLAGKSVSLKDVIAVAGVPQFQGSDITPAWTPITDATVVTRILEAGGTIVGTSTCENYCHSTSSFTSAQGTVENPHATGYSAGGSTSGGAALVTAGLVDITIGGDQGGSIRVPAALCGSALQQSSGRLNGFKIGILKEGFEHTLVDPGVKTLVLSATRKFADLGATVEEVSLPDHLHGPALWTILARIAGTQTLLGQNTGRRILCMTEAEQNRLPWTNQGFQKAFPSTKNAIINGLYLMSRFPNIYGKALNVGRQVSDKYQELFQKFDALVMPTTPVVAPRHGSRGLPLESLQPSMGMTINTAVFNVTGHPAMSIPIGFAPAKDHERVMLPVGMQIVGGLWQEEKVLRVGHGWESHYDWRKVQ
ncbi:amidase signature domain-containing protein [Aspergillus avenaceus]|uniref:Amidase signature domain-containing protein n=1 Tax=Aspergillus avenaceus TaxID=36643 RepID=A0A5N6U5F6_ASPAV|nr:amidase signature domain-containing protein [Aspergillus avenaceus]